MRVLEAVAASLNEDDLDTDAIIPVEQTKTTSRALGHALFHNRRYRADGAENPEFILNKETYRRTAILVGQRNFGCGSSREQAVWALADFGIRCVIAQSFGEIFSSNCERNGLLLVSLSQDACAALASSVDTACGSVPVRVDLERQVITAPGGTAFPFAIEPGRRMRFLDGYDPIGATLALRASIDAYRARDLIERPWVHQAATGGRGPGGP
jgi:3-isopropylmalate/(R)-2-methylmalate dehydratase small subunit